MSKEIISTGISMGTALAMILSHSNGNSILWIIIHGFFSWFYVIGYVIFSLT